MNKFPHLVFEVLAASYAYYHLNETLMTDGEYDNKIKELVRLKSKKVKRLSNNLDKLIKWKSLSKSTSLFYIQEHQFPGGLKRIVHKWLEALK